ncbi:GNAT family N-acetyltransferase [Amycolatopsis sp. H20-H5]|uniref:GNAT family N-acetyltransferase n=1 Tax=Amycolatopsis sp. H20-H5 TaxID=3046309 RepID=UPI002DBDADAD|nr:GNAT family N-acetyltransferase [Amycolatopsis sp. H20-H5]MEC3979788.1 GNAT family N-acetyltransferase [Amycolatopsis sp. H20-H5]
MRVFLETPRLRLRLFTADDSALLFELYDDPQVMRFLNGGKPADLAEIETLDIPAFLGYYERFPGYGFWAAEELDGTFLGWFHFRPAPGAEADEPELGYRLHRAAWGKGYATEGSLALLKTGFAELGIRRAVAYTMAVNHGSRRVLEKIGMRFVRGFTEDWAELIEGGEHGEVEYAITRAEWERWVS